MKDMLPFALQRYKINVKNGCGDRKKGRNFWLITKK